MGVELPTHFLKSRGSATRNNFLEYRTSQNFFFARQNVFTHYSLQIKQNIFSIGIFRDTIYSKSIQKNRKKVQFLKLYHFSSSQHFQDVKP